MPYLPIEHYGIIGNLRTVALVGINGSIDWFCYPRFDSPSVFARILDDSKGGYFCIAPARTDGSVQKQLYWPNTNVLVTRFYFEDGVGQVIDYMPVANSGEFHGIVRQVRAVRGRVAFRMECFPAFDYARGRHDTEIVEGGAKFITPQLSLALASDHTLTRVSDGVVCEFTLEPPQSASFELHALPDSHVPIGLTEQQTDALFGETIEYWQRWISKSTYRGRWREMVDRSALLLKLLFFEPSGAIVAAPTCSLPETIGGHRNWDYRYTWIRDAAFTVYALIRIGFTEEASRFMQWLDRRCHETREEERLHLIYGIDGAHELHEQTLPHLEGYRGSSPVRIGNGAWSQLQLDIYGELMDSVYLSNKYSNPISYDMWGHLRRLTDWLCDNWDRKDESIWETRSGQQNFVYSRMMCWVAFDRALRLADKRSFPADRARWLRERDAVYEQIQAKGWHQERNAFVQYYGSSSLDASLLTMPLMLFMSPSDPRVIRTIDAINRPPSEGGLVSDGLVFRYNVEETPDGLQGREGTFNMCTFWLVEALTRLGRTDRRRLDEARLLFERMLGYANHLGLYAEQTGPRGEALGNFPQAFTHLSLISSAFNLDRSLG
jgi:GH15 family glucan-1,4-alpha-glucosidase